MKDKDHSQQDSLKCPVLNQQRTPPSPATTSCGPTGRVRQQPRSKWGVDKCDGERRCQQFFSTLFRHEDWRGSESCLSIIVVAECRLVGYNLLIYKKSWSNVDFKVKKMKFVNENTRLWCNLNTGGAKGGSCCSMFCSTLGAPSSGIPWWRLRSL